MPYKESWNCDFCGNEIKGIDRIRVNIEEMCHGSNSGKATFYFCDVICFKKWSNTAAQNKNEFRFTPRDFLVKDEAK
jgi:hypothetical protein